eukprot:TRINITY_DN6241_c0_g3_i1.p1 TRINITY_DN6241_c0_g3~~TRINITY_DN6241_c0_g3_i1.p1  ORF type:complete len:225 (-),score=65.30 TRINITY_DN6241_c0_g3_i1:65-739(-)
MPSGFEAVKRSALSFKGEGEKTKKRRRDKKVTPGEPSASSSSGKEIAVDGDGDAPGDKDVPVVKGSGRIVSNTTTVNGFQTAFKDELEVGDTIMVHHPTSLEIEMRIVVSVMTQRSCVIHASFSKDCASTCEYHIRKDSLKIKEKAKDEVQDVDDPNSLQDAASAELQRQLEKKMKKAAKSVSVREKTGMWGYKVVTRKLDKDSTAEEMLDERCKQGRDKWCCI